MTTSVVRSDHSNRLQKAFATNSTATSFAVKTETLTKPSGDGVHVVAQANQFTPQSIEAQFYMVGDDNDVANFQLWSWSRLLISGVEVWVPKLIFDVAATGGAIVGVAGGVATATGRYCDTIALTYGNSTDVKLTNPQNDFVASLIAPLHGATLIEWEADMATGDPTSANALWRLV